MRNFIIRRLLLLVPIMIGVSLLTFLAYRIVPGDAVDFICPLSCSDAQRIEIRHFFGLDRPWYEQYWDWLSGVVQGDFGRSYYTGIEVSTELERRLPITLQLMVMTVAFSLTLGVPLGVISAIRPGTPLDLIARMAGVVWQSVPSYYVGTLAITFGVIWFHWVPPQFARTYISPFDDPWVNLQEFFFPSFILALGSAAFILRLVRSSLLEVLRNDFIRTAWAKGLRERYVVWRHALRNALIPLLTVIGLEIGGLLGGAVIMESMYNLNGVGKYALIAVIGRDLLVVQTLTLLFALTYVVTNLLVDLGYAWLDPRIRYS